MRSDGEALTGGQIVARALRAVGAETIFSVSGNQVLPLFDAAPEAGLRIVHTRHESAAAYAAFGFAETTGLPGVVLGSAGPGFLAAATGLATAKSAELPLLFLAGAPATTEQGRGGFQDLDQIAVARVMGKGSVAAATVADLGPAILEAWRLANASVPGPVHVQLPADLLRATGPFALARAAPALVLDPLAGAEPALAAMAEQLSRAKRPVIVARPSAGRGAAGRALERLARALGIEPVITECPRGLGDLKYERIVAGYGETDCALVLAPADFAVGFLDRSVIARHGALLQIDAPGDPEPSRRPTIHARVAVEPALERLADLIPPGPRSTGRPGAPARSIDPPPHTEGLPGLHPLEIASEVRARLRPDDVLVLDGGEYCQWIRLGFRDVPNRMLWNGKLGGIGGGLPMALGVAAAGGPGRTIAFAGDGGFGYHVAELETAARSGFPLVVIVGNDGRWGAEWHLQVDRYGADRAYATTLLPIDYGRVAAGLDALGMEANDRDSLRAALARGLAAGRPVCINAWIQSVRSPAVTQ